jgi:hypothetical protein
MNKIAEFVGLDSTNGNGYSVAAIVPGISPSGKHDLLIINGGEVALKLDISHVPAGVLHTQEVLHQDNGDTLAAP